MNDTWRGMFFEAKLLFCSNTSGQHNIYIYIYIYIYISACVCDFISIIKKRIDYRFLFISYINKYCIVEQKTKHNARIECLIDKALEKGMIEQCTDIFDPREICQTSESRTLLCLSVKWKYWLIPVIYP